MNYVTLAIPFFILLMIVEVLYGWARKSQTYRLNDTINSLQLGTLSTLKGILRLSFSALVLGALVSWLGIKTLNLEEASYPLVIWVAAFIAYDFCYYWKHRCGHEWRIMWASHAVHHQSEEYNLSTALRQTGTGYIGFVFYLPLYLAGLPVEVIITVGSLNLVYQFWVHTEHIRYLGSLELCMVTPSNHRVHHARNPGYLDKNYGGVFILWDRIFGTFENEKKDEPCVYGITQGLKSWNPIWANFHVWYETLMISLQTEKMWDKIRVWFKGPGWYPQDSAPKESTNWQYAKFDPATSSFIKLMVFTQFLALLALSLTLTGKEVGLPRELELFGFFWACLSFYNPGVWLEGRPKAEMLDWIRLIVLTNVIVLTAFLWPEVSNAYLVSAALYCLISSCFLVSRRWLDQPAVALL